MDIAGTLFDLQNQSFLFLISFEIFRDCMIKDILCINL